MSDLDALVAHLQRPDAYSHPVRSVEHIETHISHVLLAGEYAYKLKKPLDLGFLDFSTLERRRFCCEEELRLNRRLAPQTYLAVVPVTGSVQAPDMGGEGDILEYAVKMRRFDQKSLLSSRPLDSDLPERIAERVASFHQSIPSVAPERPYGDFDAVLEPMRSNFAQIRSRLAGNELLDRLQPLEAWTLRRHLALRVALLQRRARGFVRECHGDMHRGNIALDGDEILIFDGIEFNPSLRWIDTMSELAFLVMDLEEAGEAKQARRLLNRYLELTGDYDGLRVFDFYKLYRAMVRAKVIAIRLDQPDLDDREVIRDKDELEGYLDLAEEYTRPRYLGIYLAHGVSASGKSRLCKRLREQLPFIHIRSDIERKRLFGLSENARSNEGRNDAGIYGPDASERTYARLHELVGTILDAGYSPLVDATFLKASQREPFIALAKERGVSCRILDLQAPDAVLRQRILDREKDGQDPSEAGIAVLDRQLAMREPLGYEEQVLAITIDSTDPNALGTLPARLAASVAAIRVER